MLYITFVNYFIVAARWTHNSYSISGSTSSPLSPEFFPKSLTSAVLSWTPPTESPCITKYTITLTNITDGNTSYTYNTSTNTTSVTVFDLTQGAEYSFTVAGIDTVGRVGEESALAPVITLDSKLLPEYHCYKCKTYFKYRYVKGANKYITLCFMNINTLKQ